MRRVEVEHGFVVDELVESNVGTSSAVTCLTGEIYRSLATGYRDEQNKQGSLVVHARTPCEVLLFDLLLHRDIAADVNPSLLVFGDLELGSEATPIAKRSRNRIMPWKQLEHLGTGISGAYTPHLPSYVGMIDDCLGRLDWNAAEFDMYRVQIPYPVIPSSIAIQRELPKRPK